ncbi:HNH endonuclease [Actinoplanes oblitus]|uniref:HNH endonuclease n=1 Tax=Actinoplanes oblitus TaxID=3040509 RepID=A0ABY8WJC6_9ACTN|nr:HNH endonuclease [Actinoplanes oblitus]WIM96449.1 HNH endonuclease [Actinoplanes oblitus]
MTLANLDASSVLAAIAEFDRLGREKFLRTTRFGPSRLYFLEHEGRLYDSKAIAGYAHGLSTGTPLAAAGFSGGEKTVVPAFAEIGFTVRYVPRQDWTRDEIILACALIEPHGWRQLDRNDPRVAELSALLQQATIYPVDRRGPDFRTPASVLRKMADIETSHPSYGGRATNGNRLDREVLTDFLDRPAEMHAFAAAIREALLAEASDSVTSDTDVDDPVADEGSVLMRQHRRRERDPKIRRDKIAEAKRRGIAIACEVCDFNFESTYGPRGVDYIECHHRVPLHVSGQTQTRLRDLALICSNCHRMIHRTKTWLTIEELHALVKEYRR